ncbi:MAG TPA: DNA-3-methyladenine glycosylase 2 family protein [Trebonia sp.]|nr:DNA-3-methyladenine glycosylase 2 family protein [Trebonia sp.]
MTGALTREWLAPFPVDVHLTLSAFGRGLGDPTYQVDDAGAVWRTSLTPDGPGTIRILPAAPAATGLAARVIAHAWGQGGGWLLDALPAALGSHDDVSGFDPASHPVLHRVTRRHPGFRVGRSGRLAEALVPAILEQKVVSLEAHRAWKILLTRYGTPPPGPAPRGMRVFPPPETWRAIPSWEWHKAGVEGVRAQTIINAARVAPSLERLLISPEEAGPEEAGRKLRTLPGIGPWTSAETLQRAAGDPDAVSVGDYNLPKAVGYALAGREATDDKQMLELLEPYKGHRHRVARLVQLSGLRPPRRGPRMPVRDYRGF